MLYYGHSDPTAMAAIGKVSKKLKDMEPLSREEKAGKHVQFSVASVLKEKGQDQVDTLMKRLGTIALSSEMDDIDASVFCRELEKKTNGKYPYVNTYNWFKAFKRYIQRGGNNGVNNFPPVLVLKTTPKSEDVLFSTANM